MMMEHTFDDDQKKGALVVLGCNPSDPDFGYKAKFVSRVYKRWDPDLMLLVGGTFENIRSMEQLIEKVGEEEVYIGLKVRHLQVSAEDLQNLDKVVDHLEKDGVSEIAIIASYNQFERVGQYLKERLDNGRLKNGIRVGVFANIPYSVGD